MIQTSTSLQYEPSSELLLITAKQLYPYHTVEYDPFIKSQRATTQLTLVSFVVQILSRNTPKLRGTKRS